MKQITADVLMDDGTEYRDIRITMADKIAYSETRGRHNWPKVEEDPFRFMAFIAFAALRRTGKITGGFNAFIERVVDVDLPDEDDELDDVDPTIPAPQNG